MRTTSITHTRIFAALFVLALCTTQLSCKVFGQGAIPDTEPTAAAKDEQPVFNPADPERPADLPAGGTDLTDPAQGLDELSGYQQRLTVDLAGDLDGQDTTDHQIIERRVLGGDQSLRMVGQQTTSEPIYSFVTFIGETQYSQEREDGACQGGQRDGELPVELNPAKSLPAIYGMQEAGREERAGLAAVRFTFDERSLADPDGLIESAGGEVWLAEDGGVVLSYILNVTLDGQGFRGSRSWNYELSQVNEDAPISLPPGCPPLLADLPSLPGAENLELMPGFARYSAPGTREAAVDFFGAQLTAQGWQALPGSTPETADLASAATVLSFARASQDGGQVLVLQLSEAEGGLMVIAQTVLTSQPVQVEQSDPPDIQPGEGEEVDVPTPEPGGSPGSGGLGKLPEDLPFYPGAAVTGQVDYAAFLETGDPADDVAGFYQAELEKLGWTLDQDMKTPEMIFQMWSKDGADLMVTIMESGGVTQISITAAEN